MTVNRSITGKATALLLTFVMLNVYVLASAPATRASENRSLETSSLLMVGRLALSPEQSMFVNGSEATSGTTVFSGMRLQTPEGVSAAVQLGALGRLQIDPGTDLTLDFAAGYVDVKLAAGDVSLTTNAGINGTLYTADGRVLRSESSKAGTLMSASGSSAAARRLSNKEKAALIIIPIVAAIIIIAVVVSDDDDESPSNP